MEEGEEISRAGGGGGAAARRSGSDSELRTRDGGWISLSTLPTAHGLLAARPIASSPPGEEARRPRTGHQKSTWPLLLAPVFSFFPFFLS